MSDADRIAYDVQAREGWTDTTLLEVVLDYVANQESDEAFSDYLDERSDRGIRCICGYDAEDRNDLEQHILASMHSDEDHAEAR